MMFHNGFEWPKDKRETFAARIEKEQWAGWFAYAISDDEPWIFYMTPGFVQHCLSFVDQAVLSAGKIDRRLDELAASKPKGYP